MPHVADIDLTPEDINSLTSPDAVAGLLNRLGYPTAGRKELTAEALGIGGDTADAIRSIELLAEDEEGFLRVVLVTLRSVTAKARNDLAKNLGKRNADHLLILTSNFDVIEFVLIDKQTRQQHAPGGGGRVQIIPRVVPVSRRASTQLDRRILRRLTWTAKDGLEQFDKLRGVFVAAHYTGEYFQNRALFADYYLLNRLREDDAWRESPADAFAAANELMRGARSRLTQKDEQVVRDELYEPVWKLLGFKYRQNKSAKQDALKPDYRLKGADGDDLTAAFVYRWDRWLDGPDLSDPDTPQENPGAAVVSALSEGQCRWVIVTNGKLWRLYSRDAHSRSTNFYEVDLEEALHASGETDPNEAFRYWWLFFRAKSFEPIDEGEPPACWLDTIMRGSRDYAKRLSERLKDRVFVEIFPHLAQGFLADRKKRLGITTKPTEEELTDVFEATLTLLYRLLFLLHAEARDLLPVREAPYHEASLKKIKQEIAAKAGPAEGEVPGKLKKAYSDTETDLYDRLTRLFRVMDQGDPALNVPTYNGGLFIMQPAPSESREDRIAQFLVDHRVPDRFLALAIDRLARDPDEKTYGLVFIDYKSMEVRHLGSIYEGLLEFKLKVATEDLATKTEKKREKYIPLDKAKPKRGKQAVAAVRKGEVYLSNDKAERKATGSYYTPDPIVEYIVEHTVGPVLAEKLEGLRGEFRKAGKTYQRHLDNARSNPGLLPKDTDDAAFAAAKTYAEHKDLVEQLFDFKVLDPAMGSGHFLVEAVDFITDRTLDYLNRFPHNPVSHMLDRTRRSIQEALSEQGVAVDTDKLTDINLLKRHVLKRCIYGVDLNPMAVELAKVSLWLDAFTLGAPLSFLDHHLRCGNSLIGATFEDLRQATEGQLFGIDYEPLLRAINRVLLVNAMADATAAEVHNSAHEYADARKELSGYQIVLDLLVADHFLPGRIQPSSLIRDTRFDLTTRETFLTALTQNARELVGDVEEVARRPDLRFFHWEIEFPEVFFGFEDLDHRRIKHKDEIADGSSGFEAVVGNPPYDVLAEKELGFDVSSQLSYFKRHTLYAKAQSGKSNLYKLFVARDLALPREGGTTGHIVPMPLLGDKQAVKLREFMLTNRVMLRLDAFPQHIDAGKRVFEDANLTTCIFVCKRQWPSPSTVLPIRSHPAGKVDEGSSFARPQVALIRKLDPGGLTIPSCTAEEWSIIQRIAHNPSLQRMGGHNKSYQGEVNETTHRSCLSPEGQGQPVLRGANVCRYALRSSWRQNDLYLNRNEFLLGRSKDSKAYHHRYHRVGFQRSAPQNNFRRLIAAPVPPGFFCFDTVSYFIPEECSLSARLLLAVLNSEILDWFFDVASTNSKINEYRLNLLPVPRFNDDTVDAALANDIQQVTSGSQLLSLLEAARLLGGGPSSAVRFCLEYACRMIEGIEQERQLDSHRERSTLDPDATKWQAAIDQILFALYGLNPDDQAVVAKSLSRRRGQIQQGEVSDAGL